ncbi:hypothetical protein FB45DRAFT_1034562 [Roridomyces roridus]|uniref:Zn(2)-C6 fungal-type domain-containing protein n=1 Tax=Roridomyces roridus TaxID=1738132 RepID=A0AAD7BCK4_9AGAR|nr:hypothetical protein FB45DRAFT_1034562 [Roridomyces roridus]
MSTAPASYSQNPNAAPQATKKRRTIIACLTCRKRKLRCITFEQPPNSPCERCARKNIHCEYVSVSDEQDTEYTGGPVHAADMAAPMPVDPRQNPRLAHLGRNSPAPPLPYTGPPPAGQRPRFYGQTLPPLGSSFDRGVAPTDAAAQGFVDPRYLTLAQNNAPQQSNYAGQPGQYGQQGYNAAHGQGYPYQGGQHPRGSDQGDMYYGPQGTGQGHGNWNNGSY